MSENSPVGPSPSGSASPSPTVPLPPASPTPPAPASGTTRSESTPRTISLFMKDGAPIVKFGAYSDRTTLLEEKSGEQVALLQHKNDRGEVVQLIGVVSREVGGKRETVVFRLDPKNGDISNVVGDRWIEKTEGDKKTGEKAETGVKLADLNDRGQGAALKGLFDKARQEIERSQPRGQTSSSSAQSQGVREAATEGRPSPIELAAIMRQTGATNVAVMDMSGRVISERNGREAIQGPASTIKLMVAEAVRKEIVEGRLKLSDTLTVSSRTKSETDGTINERVTVQVALERMLKDSDNTATNILVEHLGGPGAAINEKFRKMGYQSTEFNRYLSMPDGYAHALSKKNQTSAIEVGRSMQKIFSATDPVARIAQTSLKSSENIFGTTGRVGGKCGVVSWLMADVAVVDVGGKKYVISAFHDGLDPSRAATDERARMARLGQTQNLICQQLRSSQSSPTPPAPVAPRQSGSSMMLVPTGRKNELGNPIYSLQLFDNGRLFRQYDTVSGRRNTQNSDRLTSGTQAPLPDGEYSVGVPVEGTNTEIGRSSDGKRWFIPTDLSQLEQGHGGRQSTRSALGIHLDPSFGQAQEDGTEGCVGLTNTKDWQEVLAWIRTKKPGVLKVNII